MLFQAHGVEVSVIVDIWTLGKQKHLRSICKQKARGNNYSTAQGKVNKTKIVRNELVSATNCILIIFLAQIDNGIALTSTTRVSHI